MLDECTGRLNGYVTLLGYRYMNLPIKAEPASLLPIKVEAGDEGSVDFEVVADVALDGDFKFNVYPKDQELLASICAGIKLQHPEFKQELVEMEESDNDDDRMLVLTMPEVDNDRYKTLTDAVNALDKECKAKLDLTYGFYSAEIATDILDADAETAEKVTKELDELKKHFENSQKEYTESKIKEIEDAYAAYLANSQQRQQSEEQTRQEEGADTVFSMKLK